jgi:hypothetical protein
MEALTYLAKTNLYLILFYCTYCLFFSRHTFFQLNRFYLLVPLQRLFCFLPLCFIPKQLFRLPELILQTPPVINTVARINQERTNLILDAEPEQSSVYPNPVGKQFTIKVSSRHSEDISLDLFNSSGQSCSVITAEKARAGQKAEAKISGPALSAGIYLLKIKSEAITEIIKVLVPE